jgi:chromosome segregation ATPase
VEEVINEWHRELQTDSKAFTQHANTIASWDRQLIQHRSFLLKLEADLGVVLASQDALERQLEILQVHQKQVDDVLEQVKGDLEQNYRDSRDQSDMGDPAVQRDAMYESAEDISAKLSYMSNDLRETITEFNKASGFAGSLGVGIGAGAAATASDPLSAIVGILNNQLKALTWIDQQCHDIEGRMKVVSSEVK